MKRLASRIKQRLHLIRQRLHVVNAWSCIFCCGICDAVKYYALEQKCKRQWHQTSTSPKGEKKGLRIAFVIPWYGENIGGGAEAETRGLIHALRLQHPNLQIEVLTTTLREFAADWNMPVHKPGTQDEDGILVHRFHPSRPKRSIFHFLNGSYLMPNAGPCPSSPQSSPIPRFAEAYFLRRMIRSSKLLEYIQMHRDRYDAFIMIPYMFSLTVEACIVAGPKGMLIPCLHHERYAYLHVYKTAFSQIGAALCHMRSEAALFASLFPAAPAPTVIGEQVDVDVKKGNPERFLKKYDITSPFILYAGRQIEGKNLPLMVAYFKHFRATNPQWSNLQFVLIGKGDLDYNDTPGIRSLGFIPAEDKIDAYRAALALVMLSTNESFSIVMMEAWLQETPSIVSADCDVTSEHIRESGGGYAVATPEAFEMALTELLSDQDKCADLGVRGRNYVLNNFTPEIVTTRFCDALYRVVETAR